MPQSSTSRGHLIVKSHRPLPEFRCVVPVPPSEESIKSLRDSIVAILTGRVSAQGSHSSSTPESGEVSYSEHLKEQTIHEWRCKSIILELKQNDIIAPETRQKTNQDQETEEVDEDAAGLGFPLQDEHECALLEHGDEISIWLREGQSLDSLRLPHLSSRHVYGMPNQPVASKFGRILYLDEKAVEHRTNTLQQRMPRISKPTEPSSHSSSVSGHPDVNYETVTRHRTGAGVNKIMTLNERGKVEEPGETLSRAQNEGKASRKPKPKRIMSEGAHSSTGQALRPVREMRSRSSSGIPQATLSTRGADHLPPVFSSSPPSSPPLTTKEVIAAAQGATLAGPSRSERLEKEKVRKAGQRGMPAQALIVGPGVQGKVGRMNSLESTTSTSQGEASGSASNGNADFGNMDAFVSFTAAGSEVHQVKRPARVSRRLSSWSASSDKNDATPSRSRTSSDARQGGSVGRSTGLMVSAPLSKAAAQAKAKAKPPQRQYVKLQDKPELPPIRNLQPFDASTDTRESLLAMPIPSSLDSPTSHSVDVNLANDAMLATALSETLNCTPPSDGGGDSSPSLLKNADREGAMSFPGDESPSQQYSPHTPSVEGRTSQQPSQKQSLSDDAPQFHKNTGLESEKSGIMLSKAERRYNEVRRQIEHQKQKQAEEERSRRAANEQAATKEKEKHHRLEQKRREHAEKARWQMWEDVRARQAKEQMQ